MFQCGINSHRLLVRGYGIDENSIHEETSEKTNDTDLNIEKEINNINTGKMDVEISETGYTEIAEIAKKA